MLERQFYRLSELTLPQLRSNLPNVVVSSHMAGVTVETHRGMAIQVTAEMLRVLRGEKPHVLANPEVSSKLAHLT